MKIFPRQVLFVGLAVICGLVVLAAPSRAERHGAPNIGETFSNDEWINYDGKRFKMDEFKGKVVLVEFVGMTCPACQAFSGAHHKGAYGGISPQPDLRSIEETFPSYAGGVSLADDRIVFVQILLFSMKMGGTSQDDALSWAKHFGLDQKKNTYVAVPPVAMNGPADYALIPGFALLDKKGVVRSLSAGDNPKQSLWKDLLPLAPKLLKE